MGNISSPSPGPPASRTRPRGPLSPQGEGFVTEILRGGNKPGQAVAPQPLGGPIQPLEPSFVFYNIPGSFVQFRPGQNQSATPRTGVIISSGMRYQPSALSKNCNTYVLAER